MHLPILHQLRPYFILSAFLIRFAAGQAIGAESASTALTYGGDLRVRNEYMNNALSLSGDATGHDQDYYRIRARFWSSWMAAESLAFNARLAAEPRVWMESPSFSKQHPGRGTEWRFGLVDNLNAQWHGSFGDNWTVTGTAGRQDVQFGETGRRWLVADGTPADGSWTSFFDAARVCFDNRSAGLKFDLVALQTRAMPASNLPILGNRKTYSLTEQNEKGLILHATIDISESAQVNGYYIYKHDDRSLASGDNADIHTFGARIAVSPSEHWRCDAEAALQFGSKEDATLKWSDPGPGRRDIRAWGGNARLSYLFKDAMNNRLSLELEYLSGDDPDTREDEMFDILWGRYPRWSDAYAFACTLETGGRIAQMNNLLRIGPVWSLSPLKKLTLNASYAMLVAPESTPTRATKAELFSFSGHTRGQLWFISARYQFTRALSGLLVAEAIRQGDFYAHGNTESFIRAELSVRF